MIEKIKIGISTCLLGEKVRYDGQHKLDRYLRDTLGKYVEWLSVCAETECGMSIPREAMSLVGKLESPDLITISSNKNLTLQISDWIKAKLPLLEKENLAGFVFKKKSPSCSLYDAKLHTENGMPFAKTSGLFAKAFTQRFPLIPVEDEGRLHDPVLRENFIERVYIYSRWLHIMKITKSKNTLTEFQKKHKLIIMSHAPSATAELGEIASTAETENHYTSYIKLLMDILKTKTTVKKHVNVLHHILGYFKNDLSDWEKKELINIIDNYYNELIPLIVPLTLLQHYIKKYNKTYLMEQYYIYQHPAELKLRNHT